MAEYVRDKRSPAPSSPGVSRVMSANRSKDTSPELELRRALRDAGLKGYRLNKKDIPGRPDIAFIGRKVAIFVNGCFWHRCPVCNLPLPKSNKDFWQEKFENNVRRDRIKKESLESGGWTVLVIWECEIKKDIKGAIDKIKALM